MFDPSKIIQSILEGWQKFDKQTKMLIRSLLYFALFLCLYGFGKFIYDSNHDKPADFLFLHNSVKPDTVYKTVTIPVYIKDTTAKINSTVSGKNVVGVITGGNPHIGDDQYVGVKQRHASNSLIASIAAKIPSDTTKVYVIHGTDKESLTYANEIESKLKKRGFKNVDYMLWINRMAFDSTTYRLNPVRFKGDVPDFSINVYPLSDIGTR